MDKVKKIILQNSKAFDMLNTKQFPFLDNRNF